MSEEKKETFFEVTPGQGYKVIRLAKDLSPNHAKLLVQEIPNLISGPSAHILINCDHIAAFSKIWIQGLLQLKAALKKEEKEIRLILVSEELVTSLKGEGVEKALPQSLNLREALVALGLATIKE